jgi:hypothetical protein
MTRYICILIALFALAACEAEPTPFPVELPVTPTEFVPATEIPPVHYALAANTLGHIAESDLDLIDRVSTIEQLVEVVNPDDLGIRYDIVVTYGDLAGWTRSAITPQAILVIDPAVDTLVPQLSQIIRQAVDPQATLNALAIPGAVTTGESTAQPPEAIRTQLANLGRPDGLHLTIGHTPVPGTDFIIQQLTSANIDVHPLALTADQIRAAFSEGRIQLALLTWTTPEQHQQWRDLFGAQNAFDLYDLPISYRALPDLVISFTPGGWPLASY